MANRSSILIKKYGNRRLYDTSGSRYVNLEEVAAMIREGRDVQVVDAKTGADLTRVTLTQIITEDARGQPGGLPLELLRQLIVATDRAGQEFVLWYLKSAFDAYQKLKTTLEDRLTDVQASTLSPLLRSLMPAAEAAPKNSGRRKGPRKESTAAGRQAGKKTEGQKTTRRRFRVNSEAAD